MAKRKEEKRKEGQRNPDDVKKKSKEPIAEGMIVHK